MNCEQIQQRMDDYLDGDLDLEKAAELHAHINQCHDCRARLRRAEVILAGLKSVRVPAMRPGFAAQAVRQAAGQSRPRSHRRAFVAGFGSALVAGLAMWMALGGLLPGGRDAAPSRLQEVAISVAAPQTVNLAFDVGYPIQDATLSLNLPDNVELVGFPGISHLSWQISLTQGRNVLPLPLKGATNANGELVATLEHDGKRKSVRIKVRVEDEVAPQAEIQIANWVYS